MSQRRGVRGNLLPELLASRVVRSAGTAAAATLPIRARAIGPAGVASGSFLASIYGCFAGRLDADASDERIHVSLPREAARQRDAIEIARIAGMPTSDRVWISLKGPRDLPAGDP